VDVVIICDKANRCNKKYTERRGGGNSPTLADLGVVECDATCSTTHPHARSEHMHHSSHMATQQNRGLATENQRGADAAGAGADARRELGEVNDIVEHSAQAKTRKVQGKESGQSACIAFEHIELPAKLLDYFLRSNKSNIKQ